MIRRLVTMKFSESGAKTFLEIFEENKNTILNSQGCRSIKLLTNKNTVFEFTTDSVWESEEALNAYRNSELFISVWKKVKPLFIEPAQAETINLNV